MTKKLSALGETFGPFGRVQINIGLTELSRDQRGLDMTRNGPGNADNRRWGVESQKWDADQFTTERQQGKLVNAPPGHVVVEIKAPNGAETRLVLPQTAAKRLQQSLAKVSETDPAQREEAFYRILRPYLDKWAVSAAVGEDELDAGFPDYQQDRYEPGALTRPTLTVDDRLENSDLTTYRNPQLRKRRRLKPPKAERRAVPVTTDEEMEKTMATTTQKKKSPPQKSLADAVAALDALVDKLPANAALKVMEAADALSADDDAAEADADEENEGEAAEASDDDEEGDEGDEAIAGEGDENDETGEVADAVDEEGGAECPACGGPMMGGKCAGCSGIKAGKTQAAAPTGKDLIKQAERKLAKIKHPEAKKVLEEAIAEAKKAKDFDEVEEALAVHLNLGMPKGMRGSLDRVSAKVDHLVGRLSASVSDDTRTALEAAADAVATLTESVKR